MNPVVNGSGFSIAGNHVYRYGGRYNVTVIIQSYDGAGARVSETAIVSGRRPQRPLQLPGEIPDAAP